MGMLDYDWDTLFFFETADKEFPMYFNAESEAELKATEVFYLL